MEPEMHQFTRILTELDAAIKNQRNTNAAAGGALTTPTANVPTAPAIGGATPFTDFISGVSCLTGVSRTGRNQFILFIQLA